LIAGTSGRNVGQSGPARPGMRRVNPVGGMIGEGDASTRLGSRGSVPLSGEPMVGGRAAGGRPASGSNHGMSAARGVPEGERQGSAGARGTLSERPYGQAGGRKATRRNPDGTQSWDPDNPWETEEGVDPVLLPPREQPVDPGPAIGLH
jgi:hypothetical protein